MEETVQDLAAASLGLQDMAAANPGLPDPVAANLGLQDPAATPDLAPQGVDAETDPAATKPSSPLKDQGDGDDDMEFLPSRRVEQVGTSKVLAKMSDDVKLGLGGKGPVLDLTTLEELDFTGLQREYES